MLHEASAGLPQRFTSSLRLTSQAITDLATSAESAVAVVTTPLAVPAMPIGLTASAGSPYSITISWQAGNAAGGAVAGYIPSISSDEGQTFTSYSTLPVSPGTTSVTFNNLTPKTVYLFEVVAENSAGNSDYAGPVGARTPAVPPSTLKPTLFLDAADSDWQNAHLYWTYPGTDAGGFEFEDRDSTKGEDFHYDGNTAFNYSNNTVISSTLIQGDTYQFRMLANHDDGTFSAWCDAVSYTVPTLTPAPSVDAYVARPYQFNPVIVLGWSGVASGYAVQVEFKGDSWSDSDWVRSVYDNAGDQNYAASINAGTTYPTASGSAYYLQSGDQGCLIDPGYNASGEFFYRARAIAPDGEATDWSGMATASLGHNVADAPTASQTATTITLNWQGHADAGTITDYAVRYATTQPAQLDLTSVSTQQTIAIGRLDASSSTTDITQAMTYTFTDLSPGVTYHFAYIVTTEGDTGAAFNQLDVTTNGAVQPNSPFGLIVSLNQDNQVQLHWTDNSANDTGFEIQRSVDDVNFTPLTDTPDDTTDDIDATALPDSKYFYRVYGYCVNAAGTDTVLSPVYTTGSIDTPGVAIVVESSQVDPAFNPEIWVDHSAMNYSTGQIAAPTQSDLNVVPVVVKVPLGEDDYGTATLTWGSTIRLYNASGGQVGSLTSGGTQYSLTWTVSDALQRQTFIAQAISSSARLGDQAFGVSTHLDLYSAEFLVSGPSLIQVATDPAAIAPVTEPAFYFTTNKDHAVDSYGSPYAMVGAGVSASVVAAPAIIFPPFSKYLWEVGDAVASYITDNSTGEFTPFSECLGDIAFHPHWYWIAANTLGLAERIDVVDTENGLRTLATINVYKPTASFTLQPTNEKTGLGPTNNHNDVRLYFGDSPNPTPDFGVVFSGSISTPNLADSAGEFGWFQLINWKKQASGLPYHEPTVPNYVYFEKETPRYELDTRFPASAFDIGANTVININIHASIVSHQFGDAPDEQVLPQVTYLSVNSSYRVYIIYKSGNVGSDSIWVPLQWNVWTWNAAMNTNVNGKRYITGIPDEPKISVFSVFHLPLPTWNSNVLTFQNANWKRVTAN